METATLSSGTVSSAKARKSTILRVEESRTASSPNNNVCGLGSAHGAVQAAEPRSHPNGTFGLRLGKGELREEGDDDKQDLPGHTSNLLHALER